MHVSHCSDKKKKSYSSKIVWKVVLTTQVTNLKNMIYNREFSANGQ